MRLPLGVAPYLCKIALYGLSRGWLERHWHDYSIQALRAAGDLLNLAGSAALILSVAQSPWLRWPLTLACAAEAVRLLTEKGMMALSAAWQTLPHRQIAGWLAATPLEPLVRAYCRYYRLSNRDRLRVVLVHLRGRAAHRPETAQKLRYISGFRIVPNGRGLRCGSVRDVALGEIFVHARWTNHPGLLVGLALRRAPWIFDPRHLARPFYYRTQANRLMTLFVFENARLCPLYAVYQFGHEIKSARYDAFYRMLAWIGIRAEEPVREDGTYTFEPLALTLKWIAPLAQPRPLWTDDEVLRDLARDPALSALTVARRYTYPLLYVEEVLSDKIACATNAGASQCG